MANPQNFILSEIDRCATVYQRESITNRVVMMEISNYQWWMYLKEKKFKNSRHAKANTEASFYNGEVTLHQNQRMLVLTFATGEYEKAEFSKNCYGKVQLNNFLSFVFDTGKVVGATKMGRQISEQSYP